MQQKNGDLVIARNKVWPVKFIYYYYLKKKRHTQVDKTNTTKL